jgi:hypothetical protein
MTFLTKNLNSMNKVLNAHTYMNTMRVAWYSCIYSQWIAHELSDQFRLPPFD